MIYNINDIVEVLSESTVDYLYNLGLYIEAEGNDSNSKRSEKFKKFAHSAEMAYINILNKSSEAIAKKVVKKPNDNASVDIQEKYQEKLIKAKAAIKVGIILSSKLVLMGPLDWIATVALVNSITKSDDPTDKMVVEKLKLLSKKAEDLKQKALVLFEKNKDKPITEDSFKKPYEAITLQGLNIAKEMDATKAKINKEKQVSESTLLNMFDEYLLQEDGTLVDNAYEILLVIVEKTDYEKFDIFNLVEQYIDMMA